MTVTARKNISSHTKIAGVIGDPISHSLSPVIHNYLLNKYKIDGLYLPFKVTKNNLSSTVKTLSQLGFKGFNVTIPHKENIFKICDNLSKTAKIVKAVNTVVITQNQKIFGHNSDGKGFIQNIKQNISDFDFKNKNIAILGQEEPLELFTSHYFKMG